MKRFISLIIAIVLLINQNNFCFGFQFGSSSVGSSSSRSSSSIFRVNLHHHNHQSYTNTILYMAESSSEDGDNSKNVKLSKRKRFKDLVKRMSFIRRREEYKQQIIQDDVPKEKVSTVSSADLAQMLRESADIVEKKENNLLLYQTLQALTSYVGEYTDDDDNIESNESTISEDILLSNNETLSEDTKSATSSSDDISVSSSRSSKAADNVNLSGTWRPIVTPEFKEEYDEYLKNCSQSYMFRKIAVNGISLQKEIFRQLNDGIDLEIIATNPAGNWNRTLVASDLGNPLNTTIIDPDGDSVQVEAWWEDDGTKHKSLLQGKPRVEGGVFETVRYLESEDIMVCESSFLPPASSKKFKNGFVTWKFDRWNN